MQISCLARKFRSELLHRCQALFLVAVFRYSLEKAFISFVLAIRMFIALRPETRPGT